MRLALECGRADFERFATEITSYEFECWKAFFGYEPFGDEVRQLAKIAQMVAPQGWKKTGGGEFTVEDFLPPGTKRNARRWPTPEELDLKLEAMAAAYGAKKVSRDGSHPTPDSPAKR